MEAVLVVQPAEDEPSIVFSACADGHVLLWELDADLNADSYMSATIAVWPLLPCLHCQHFAWSPVYSAFADLAV